MRSRNLLHRAGLVLAAAAIPLASVAEVTPSQAMAEVEELRRLLEAQRQQQLEQQRLLEQQTQQLQAQQRALDELKEQLAAATAPTPPAEAASPPPPSFQTPGTLDTLPTEHLVVAEPMAVRDARGGQQGDPSSSSQAEAQTQRQGAQPRKTPPTEQVGERPPERESTSDPLSVADVIRDQSILTPKGSFVFTPSFAYTNDSNVQTQITGFSILPAFIIGLFDIRKINRNTFVTTLTGRYGLTRKVDLELKIPYVYRDDSVRAREFGVGAVGDTRFSASGGDIGDVEAALRYQFQRPSSKWPFITGGLRVKSNTGKSPYDIEIDEQSLLPSGDMPTGSGFWGIKPSVFFMYPSDPVVYFSELSYQWNIEKDVGRNIGEIDPGDFIGFDFGMGFALNEKASFTLGYQHRTVLKTEQEGQQVGDTLQVASLITSFAYKYSNKGSVNLSIAAGLTEDSPELQLTLSLPISFDL